MNATTDPDAWVGLSTLECSSVSPLTPCLLLDVAGPSGAESAAGLGPPVPAPVSRMP